MIEKEDTFCHLVSMHNISFNYKVMRLIRQAIFDKRLGEFLEYM
jgi:tRNA-guanine family transglycosylase